MKRQKFQTKQKIKDLLRALEIELKTIFGVKLKKFILFGSYSRGDYDTESDVDVMVLINELEPRKYDDTLLELEVDLSIAFDVVLSIFVENEAEYREARHYKPFLQAIEREGVEIYAA